MSHTPPESPADIAAIRALMERSSRFVSLSGLSGIAVGIIALVAGAVAALIMSQHGVNPFRMGRVSLDSTFYTGDDSFPFFWDKARNYIYVLAAATFALAAFVATYFTRRRARLQGHTVWNSVTRRLFLSVATPLIVGGIFCLILEYHGHWLMIVPATMVFYGLALVNGSKFTLGEIYWMGICFCIGGLLCAVMPRYAFAFWCATFGGLHIVYGSVMYYKYERK